jgi:hypothetical protein
MSQTQVQQPINVSLSFVKPNQAIRNVDETCALTQALVTG